LGRGEESIDRKGGVLDRGERNLKNNESRILGGWEGKRGKGREDLSRSTGGERTAMGGGGGKIKKARAGVPHYRITSTLIKAKE